MPGSTSPLGFPYPVEGDALTTWRTITQQLAEAVDDYMTALAAVAPADWTDLDPVAVDITGYCQYARRAGTVFVEIGLTIGAVGAASGVAITDPLPAGFRPSRRIVRQVQGGGTLRGLYIDPDGALRVDFGGTASATFFGGFAFPV